MMNLLKISLFSLILISLISCGGFEKVDLRKTPVNMQERAKKNVEEGQGTSIQSMSLVHLILCGEPL